MRGSAVVFVRGGGRGILSMFGSKQTAKATDEANQLTKEQQEKLRGMLPSLRTDETREKREVKATGYSDELAYSRFDMDAIRARGTMKYRFAYNPPKNVVDVIQETCENVAGGRDVAFSPGNNELKAKVILKLSEKLRHSPPNSRLHEINGVSDLIAFYSEPVTNLDSYTQMARSESKPKNVSVLEQPSRFHPEDTDAWHGGVTAFPGTGGQVLGLRNQRLLRQFRPKSEWFDYEEQVFDHTRPDKDMPWDPEVAKRMDRFTMAKFFRCAFLTEGTVDRTFAQSFAYTPLMWICKRLNFPFRQRYPDRKLNLKTKTFARS